MNDQDLQAIVLDHGSYKLKAGFGGENAPKVIISSMVGTHKSKEYNTQKELYIGQKVQEQREMLDLAYPMEEGVIKDWDAIEKVWHHLFHQELDVHPNEHPMVFCEPHIHPKLSRERITQILFEKFTLPGLYFQSHGVLALYSTGKTSGCVFDSGHCLSHVVPVLDGFAQVQNVARISMAGRDITNYLKNLLSDQLGSHSAGATPAGSSISPVDVCIARAKEKFGYIATNYDQELSSCSQDGSLDKTFELPDGNQITLGSERFKCAEAIFQPALMGKHMCSAHECIYTAISQCNYFIRDDLFGNVVISGGNMAFPGICDRMTLELAALAPSSIKVNVEASDSRKHAVWLGGSQLASIQMFPQMWVSKSEYDESGPSIMNRKCF